MQMVFLRSSRAMDGLSSCWENESFRQQTYRYNEINKCIYIWSGRNYNVYRLMQKQTN